MPQYRLKDFFSSARGMIYSIAILMMAVEFVIMVLIEGIFRPAYGEYFSPFFWEILDPILLILFVLPAIYLLTIRPFERQQALLRHHFNELSIAAVTFESQEGVLVTDAGNKILKVNHSFNKITGYSNEEVIGQTPAMLRSGRHDNAFYRKMWEALQRDRFWSGEVWNRNKSGKVYPEWLTITAVLGENGEISNYVGIFSDISERKAGEEQLRELTAHLQTVREEEKTRLAREIHDDLGGTLTALKMETYALANQLAANDATARLTAQADSITQLLNHAVSVTRRVITDLHPTVLDDLGLVAALEWQAGQFQKRTGIPCEVMHDGGYETKLDKKLAINLFRIFQEALTNVSQHSGATRVHVEFMHNDDEIFLSISDNGKGLPDNHAASQTSYGMRGMKERVAQLNGRIFFDKPLGGGLRVNVEVPHEPKMGDNGA
jgi:PAS domain S-box-containing protein